MNNIHTAAIKRLFFGWLLVSLLIGGGAWWYGVRQINQQVLALAESEVRKVAPEVLKRLNGTPMDIMALQVMASDYHTHGFVGIELYNRHGQLVVQKNGVEGKRIEAMLDARGRHKLPEDKEVHAEFMRLGNTRIIRVLVPLQEDGTIAGHFEGVYIVPEEKLSSLERQTQHLLIMAFVIALFTTLLLYPFIISLNRKVHAEAHAILRGNMELMKVLGSAIAKRDSDTNSHNFRVTLYSVRLGEAIQMHKHLIKELIAGAFLHDVGKIGIHDAILLKPGPLTPEEFSIMKQHVKLGLDIISHSSWLRHAADVVGNHHEWFDGNGYPKGVAGESIPLTARVFAIADVFDALTSVRPYKQALSLEQSLDIMRKDTGTHFEPRLFEVFQQIAPALYQRFSRISDAELEKDLQEIVLLYWNGEK
ncbi:HD domain-containing protein [Formivibrio citricus]|uniref:HD domain-containing protein n=1 Tax=Formivibrio citricus TaxID=83765 RepID=A0A1I4V5W2_9NEIS|nr:HD-GYP domain-containing protein [Formivibrio citricus]SFM96533.1 HD domain-containing protein [Formivibrio citricus]